MKTLINTAAALALAGTTALGMTGAAHAASEAPGVTVSFADLNLATETGTRIFDRRIEAAVRKACGGDMPRDLDLRRGYLSCIEETSASARPARDLAVRSYRQGSLAANDRVIRFAAN